MLIQIASILRKKASHKPIFGRPNLPTALKDWRLWQQPQPNDPYLYNLVYFCVKLIEIYVYIALYVILY